MKKGLLGRADLLTAIVEKDSKTQKTITDALGLKPLQEPEEAKKKVVQGTTRKTQEDELKPLHRSPTLELRFRYWQLVKQEDLGKEKKESSTQQKNVKVAIKAVWRNKPKSLPAYPALTSLNDLRTRLFPALHRQYHGRAHIDIPKVIDKLSRAELLDNFPKRQQQHNLHSLHIVDDRQISLTPYWLDHVWVTRYLYDEFTSYQISRAVLQNGEEWPQLIRYHEGLVDYQLPPANTPVLILSDLGRLVNRGGGRFNYSNHHQKKYWRLIKQFLENGNPVTVLSPCHLNDYPFTMRQQIQFISWEKHAIPLPNKVQGVSHKGETENKLVTWLELLRILVAPIIRLEPQILRAIRQGLREYGYKIPASVEALFWQHHDIKEPHNVAATLDAQSNKQYRKKFAEEKGILQAFALKIIKQWRGNLPPEIWFEEILGIESMLDAANIFCAEDLHAFYQDVDDACNFLQQIIDQKKLKLQGEKGDAYRAWVARLESRICEIAVQRGKGGRQLQTTFYLLSPYEKQSRGGYIIDLDLLPPPDRRKETAWLCLHGSQLAVCQYQPSQVPFQNTSIIAPIEYKHPHIKVVKENGESYRIELPSQRLSNNGVQLLQSEEKIFQDGVLTLQTDYTKLVLQTVKKPAWAIGMGRDCHGLFADMVLAKNEVREPLVQRFRWIAAGEFMMGSPESEEERWDREDYHRVTLTNGYWLADTTVTQAVWQAVTGENPSRFQGSQNPVEQISWDDVQTFIEQLNKSLKSYLGRLIIRLPTDAEWEHACRAETDTPFSFGENITPEQVNYNGNFPYAGGDKGEYRKKTVSVKSLLSNPWGLYEMHGNVWEWCADGWQKNLGTEDVIDPYIATGSDRVMRGGSWLYDGGYVRSACRFHYSPGDRHGGIGFRLALGHVTQVAVAKVKEEEGECSFADEHLRSSAIYEIASLFLL